MEMERRDFLKLTAGALTYALATEPTWAQTAKVEVHWLGQATTKLTTLTGKVIVIDPFLTDNPKTPPQYKNLDALGKVDVILVTHAPADPICTIGPTDAVFERAAIFSRSEAHREVQRARSRHDPDRRPLRHGPARRGVRDAGDAAAEARDPDPLRNVPRAARHAAGVPDGARSDPGPGPSAEPGRQADLLGPVRRRRRSRARGSAAKASPGSSR